nr:RNA-directed DNA polymerase [Ipomoea batatas]
MLLELHVYPDPVRGVAIGRKTEDLLTNPENDEWLIGYQYLHNSVEDLNVACPKDDFSLCIIESMTDVVTRHEIMLFMDDFSNYNQIRMASEDEELIAF